jgi:membrane-bound acyltransferase YfiQ involved in biofilm formation
MVTQGIFFVFTLVFQLLFYGTALLNYVSKNNSSNKLSSVISFFVVISIAYLMGWIKYFAGETFSTWEPERKQD